LHLEVVPELVGGTSASRRFLFVIRVTGCMFRPARITMCMGLTPSRPHFASDNSPGFAFPAFLSSSLRAREGFGLLGLGSEGALLCGIFSLYSHLNSPRLDLPLLFVNSLLCVSSFGFTGVFCSD
jgi:hypothetical protein